MALTTAQQTTLRNAVLADPVLSTYPHNSDGALLIAQAMNLTDTSNTQVWWSATPADAIFNTITWANYTPNDAVPTSTGNTATDQLNVGIWTARCLAAQTKQMNLQNLLTGRSSLNMINAQTRAGLRDAVIQLPTGTGGAMTSAGGASGVTTLTACIRPTLATRAEKLFSGGASTTGTVTADMLTFEGQLGYPDVMTAMGW